MLLKIKPLVWRRAKHFGLWIVTANTLVGHYSLVKTIGANSLWDCKTPNGDFLGYVRTQKEGHARCQDHWNHVIHAAIEG